MFVTRLTYTIVTCLRYSQHWHVISITYKMTHKQPASYMQQSMENMQAWCIQVKLN